VKTTAPEKLPLVSVLMPAYNHQEFIAQAIESIWEQTYKNVELIVVDDGSSDDSYQIAIKMLSMSPIPMRVFKNENNRGLCASLNRLLKMANGKYLMFHADDDFSVPTKIQKLKDVMEADSSIVGVHSSLREMDSNGNLIGSRMHNRFDRVLSINNIPELILKINQMSVVTQSHLFRRVVFDYFGEFDESCTHEAKAILFREVFLGKLVYVRDELTYYRVGSGTSTQDFSQNIKSIVEHSRKVNGWNYSALRNINMDLGVIKKDVSMHYWLYVKAIFFISFFRYDIRHRILNKRSFLSFVISFFVMDRVSVGFGIKIFFPNFYLKIVSVKKYLTSVR
jgi:alpha-1,3-rhamnosyltransferase